MLRFLIGVVLGTVALGAAYGGVRALRRAVMPSWSGAPGALVDAVGMVTTVILVTQLLGLLALYGLAAGVVAFVAAGYGLFRLAEHLAGRVDTPIAAAPPDLMGRPGRVLAAVGTSAALGPWVTRAAVGFTAGMPGADTQWYHLPAAAKLVQTGSLRQIEVFDGGNLTAFYPLASTWFHATGMLFLESDILSPLVNLGWAGLALLACWLLGRPFGVSSATLLAGAASLAFPGFVGHNGGSAMNDVVVLALVLAALALLVNADTTRLTIAVAPLALAGFATGAALGTKWTIIPATAAMTAAVIVAARRGPWLRSGGVWLVASGLTGLFTYVRNFVIVGSPLPPQDLGLGPIRFESVRDTEGVASVASWLDDDTAWDAVFRPGLDLWFGPLWPVALALVAVGLLVGLATGPGVPVRIAAFTGFVGAVGYLFMPQNLEVFGLPNYFLSNLRYGAVAITIGFVLLSISPALRRPRLVWLPTALMTVVLMTALTASGTWTGIVDWRYQDNVGTDDTVVGLAAAAVLAVIGVALVSRPDLARPVAIGLAGITVLAGVAGFDAYRDARYADPFHEAHVLSDARVAVSGTNVQYMFYGPDLGNFVQYVGEVDDGVVTPPVTCRDWIGGLTRGGFTHAAIGVIDASLKDVPGPYRWTADDPNTTLVRDTDGTIDLFRGEASGNVIALFAIDGELDLSRCDA